MNKKALQASSYARVRVLPMPLMLGQNGEELPLRDDTWMMVATDTEVRIQNITGERYSLSLRYDFVAGYTEDPCAPNDGLKHGILKLHGTIQLQRFKNARITPLTPQTVDVLIVRQERELALSAA